MNPTLKNTLVVDRGPRAIDLYTAFTNVAAASKKPYFAWGGMVYKVEIPSCGCLGRGKWVATGLRYSSLPPE